MGNASNKQPEGYENQLPDSPTTRNRDNLEFPLTVEADPLKHLPAERLPRQVIFRLTPSHCELWASEKHNNVACGPRPIKNMSYFSILGWGHSEKLLRIVESGEEVHEGQMKKVRRVYQFFTDNGDEIATALSTNCHAIVADIETKKSDRKMVEKEQEWNEYWHEKAENEVPSPEPKSVSPLRECMSPVARAGAHRDGLGDSPMQSLGDSPITFSNMDLPEAASPPAPLNLSRIRSQDVCDTEVLSPAQKIRANMRSHSPASSPSNPFF